MKTVLPLLFCALLLASCSPPPPDVAEVRKTIEAMMDKAAKEMMAGKIDTIFADYTDDAVSLPNFSPMLKGKKAFKEHAQQMMSMSLKFSNVKFETMDVQVHGRFAYEIGTYTMTTEMKGMPPMPDEGKYLTVYEKGADGKWRIKVETWNTNKMPPTPEPGT